MNGIKSVGKGKSGTVYNLEIYDGQFYLKGYSGEGISASDVLIDGGYIEIYIKGYGNGISGDDIEISDGVVKTCSQSGNDIKGMITTIADTANVQAYNNNVSGTSRSQKKLTSDLLRNFEGIAILDGDYNRELKTDKSGDMYYWGSNDTIFDINGMRFVI